MRTRIISAIRIMRHACAKCRPQEEGVVQRVCDKVELPMLEFCEAEIRRGTDIFAFLIVFAKALGRILGCMIAAWRPSMKSRFELSTSIIGEAADSCVRCCQTMPGTEPTPPSNPTKH